MKISQALSACLCSEMYLEGALLSDISLPVTSAQVKGWVAHERIPINKVENDLQLSSCLIHGFKEELRCGNKHAQN